MQLTMAVIQSLEATWTFCFKLIFYEVKTHPVLWKAREVIS